MFVCDVDPGVDSLKRGRLTPKLFDCFVNASHLFRRRRREFFLMAITAESVGSKRSPIQTERLQVEHSTAGIGRTYALHSIARQKKTVR